MTIDEFDKEYWKSGGFKTLDYFRREQFTLDYIGKHFGVTVEAVRFWFKDFFNSETDIRIKRKEVVINKMLEFAEKYGLEKFKEAYYYTAKYYYDIALSEAYVRGIFKEIKNEHQ